MQFRVLWEAEIDGKIHEGIEPEGSWFLIDQQGKMFVHGPCEPIRPVGAKEYIDLVPLIKINNEWLAIDEIEKRIRAC